MTPVRQLVRVLRGAVLLLGLPGVLFAAWWLASADSTNFYWPPLREILVAFRRTWTTGPLFAEQVLPSLARLGAGYALALLLGAGLGIAIGQSRTLSAVTEPVLELLRAIPPPVLVPVLMLVAGIGDTMKVLVIVSGCVWPILLNTVQGVRATDEVLADTCRSYRIRGLARLRHLVLRSASPQLVTGARQALAIGIILMVISEIPAANNGLGFTVVQFQRSFAIREMWSGVLLLGLLGVALSLVFRLAERYTLRWYHGLRAAEKSR